MEVITLEYMGTQLVSSERPRVAGSAAVLLTKRREAVDGEAITLFLVRTYVSSTLHADDFWGGSMAIPSLILTRSTT